MTGIQFISSREEMLFPLTELWFFKLDSFLVCDKIMYLLLKYKVPIFRIYRLISQT